VSSGFSVEPSGEAELLLLDRPDRLNALNRPLIRALTAYFSGLVTREDLRVVLLGGRGRAFCAGLDLAAWRDCLERSSVAEIAAIQQEAGDLIRAMRKAPQPMIGLGHGFASGIGFAMLLACDIRLGAPSLRMNVASVRIGLSGADVGISYLLPRLIGEARAAELMLTGRMLEGEEARAIGLLAGLVEEDALVGAGLGMAREIVRNAPLGIRFTKSAIAQAADSLELAMAIEDRQQILLAGTSDHREAVSAFLEKRSPVFTGG
jgi:enoyl-CoA hydratase/carnithine racemase